MGAAIPIVAGMAAGAGTSMATGYAIDMTIGDGHYTRRDAAIDATLGAVGVGSMKNVGRGLHGGIKYWRKGRKAAAAGDDVADITKVGITLVGDVPVSDINMIANVSMASAGYHAVLLGTSEALNQGPPTRGGQLPVEVRNTIPDAKIEPRDPITVVLIQLSGKSSNSNKTRRAPKRCRCKDGSYSTKCC